MKTIILCILIIAAYSLRLDAPTLSQDSIQDTETKGKLREWLNRTKSMI